MSLSPSHCPHREEDAVFSIFDAMGVRSPSQPDTLSMASGKEAEKKKKRGRERERERERDHDEKETGLMSLGKSSGRAALSTHAMTQSPLTHQGSSLPLSGVSSPPSVRVDGISSASHGRLLVDPQRVKERSDVSREIMESFLRSLPSRNDVAVNPYLESSLRVYQLISVVKSPMVSLPSFCSLIFLITYLISIRSLLLLSVPLPSSTANHLRHFETYESISFPLSCRTSGFSLFLSLSLFFFFSFSFSLSLFLF
jgi:hypothetical protein